MSHDTQLDRLNRGEAVATYEMRPVAPERGPVIGEIRYLHAGRQMIVYDGAQWREVGEMLVMSTRADAPSADHVVPDCAVSRP